MPDTPRKKPDLPESTLRIMERMVKAPPKPRGQKSQGADPVPDRRPSRLSEQKRGKQGQGPKK